MIVIIGATRGRFYQETLYIVCIIHSILLFVFKVCLNMKMGISWRRYRSKLAGQGSCTSMRRSTTQRAPTSIYINWESSCLHFTGPFGSRSTLKVSQILQICFTGTFSCMHQKKKAISVFSTIFQRNYTFLYLSQRLRQPRLWTCPIICNFFQNNHCA